MRRYRMLQIHPIKKKLSLFYGHVVDKDLDRSKALKIYVESNNSEIKGEKNSRIMKKKLFWGHSYIRQMGKWPRSIRGLAAVK